MIPELRQAFSANYTGEKYRTFLQSMGQRCGTPVKFRLCETPCFFPKPLLDKMAAYGDDLIRQLVNDPEYLAASDRSVPAEFNAPRQTEHPLFIQVDFGVARDAAGDLQPKLVEIQGFPSLYAFQAVLAQEYQAAYDLDSELRYLLGNLDPDSYHRLLRRAILGDCDPENVILMEVDPQDQKTLPDFLLTERMSGIRTVCITDVEKQGNRLYYRHGAKRIPIHRIYNRAIADELIRKGTKLSFDFRDDLNVEWAGHPNWFFRISKFSIPFLRHECVPGTWFLEQVESLPADPENYVIKPLYSFAGLGVIVGPTREQIAEVARANYILQERVKFEPVIETPFGLTKAELRIMYLWLDRLTAGPLIVRMGRGKMMGVDQNRDEEWVGASAAFYPSAPNK